MKLPKQRVVLRAVAIATASATATSVLATPAFAVEHTFTKQITAKCKTGSIPVVGPQSVDITDPVKVQVTAPDAVKVGETFTAKVKIDPINVSLGSLPSGVSLVRASRMKMDLLRPTNLELVSATFTGGNIDVSQAEIITVDEQGKPDPHGTIFRLTDKGHNTIGNGGAEGQKNHAGLGLDLAGKNSIDLQFPEVTLTMKATAAGTGVVGLRTAGLASRPGNAEDAITVLASARVPLLGENYVTAGCVPQGPDASNLASVAVKAEPTATSLTVPDQVTAGEGAEYIATVTPALPGTMRFSAGTQTQEVPVDGATGVAKARLTLGNAVPTEVTATFVPADAATYESSSQSKQITASRRSADLKLDVDKHAVSGATTQVTATLPEGAAGKLLFKASDGQERAVDVRAGGLASATFIFGTPGEVGINAIFEPAPESRYDSASANATTMVSAATRTGIAFVDLPESARIGEKLQVKVRLQPTERARTTDGIIEFDFDGEKLTQNVTEGEASVEWAPTHLGATTVTVRYVPASSSNQTPASVKAQIDVRDDARGSIEITGAQQVAPGASYDYDLAVTDADGRPGEGTADLYLDNLKVATKIAVAGGTAKVRIAIPRSGTAVTSLRAEYTPAGAATVTVTGMHALTAAPVGQPESVMASLSPATFQATTGQHVLVRFEASASAGVPGPAGGYIELTSNGEPVTGPDGQPLRVTVVDGTAETTVMWKDSQPQEKNLTATYYAADGTKLAEASTVVSVTGDTVGDDGHSTGSSSSPSWLSGIWAKLGGFFAGLWNALKALIPSLGGGVGNAK